MAQGSVFDMKSAIPFVDLSSMTQTEVVGWASPAGTYSYTVQKDCLCIFHTYPTSGAISLSYGNIEIFNIGGSASSVGAYFDFPLYLKAGTVLSVFTRGAGAAVFAREYKLMY